MIFLNHKQTANSIRKNHFCFTLPPSFVKFYKTFTFRFFGNDKNDKYGMLYFLLYYEWY